MKWNELYSQDRMPSMEEIRGYIGEARPQWDELVSYIEETYQPKCQIDFSRDALQPGWNVKYRKSGKALCTLYPMEGYFIALVVVGPKEEEAVRLHMKAGLFTANVRDLYEKARRSPMGRWLMIEVKNQALLKDIQRLLRIRISPLQREVTMKTLNQLIEQYTRELQRGELQTAYRGIAAFLGKLRGLFIKNHPELDVSSVYQGYMDMSYFSVTNEALKKHGLKVAIVYLHEKGSFEVWLSARNRKTAESHASKLSHYISGAEGLFHDAGNPDAIMESVVTSNPDFDDESSLAENIQQGVERFIEMVNGWLEFK